ncbi:MULTISPECIES: AbrB/MazE/SpoVT family DNA-binding domain-containing protein [Halococcus]|uniref:AbrB/MazE/SpoVT family DNA-binding domain-containing protein n=1 Tax=Halococcus TaxID=2249 RepID=UPI000E747C6E|nr:MULTISPECIES: AbrB/MazE/SpoVT family DNA-binding domain-containing protein [Halococcus]RJS99643.1 AbrB/MazE/SpoVT family DNA-binding domain-containing protein [Halococcus sp. IIIV-5B]
MSGTTRDVVRVSAKGQATIPKQLREKFGIETPGRVRFRESEAGEIVVEPVPRPSELRGRLATDEYERGEITAKLQEFRDSERVEERPRDVANPDGDE